MNHLSTALRRARTNRRLRREDRALRRAVAAAPTLESAHELAALRAHL